MNFDELRCLHMQAIQTIPGNTASEKQKWIGKSASQQLHVIQDPSSEQFSSETMSILLLEVAVKHKGYKDITLALKSDDWTIVNRALKATWFFDGSQKMIDAKYFSECVFPYITYYTKIRIMYTFIRCIKNPSFAQAIFNALTIFYNFETVLPLLMNCNEEFIYKTVVEKRLILPVRIFKKIYYKNPELGVRLLKEYIRHYKVYRFCNRQRNLYGQACLRNIFQEYRCILHTLAKKKSMEFVDIVQNVIKTEELCSEIGVLSKKCAKKFLKKAKNAVIEYSHLYMPILPSQLISTDLLELMFPDLMKFHCRDFFCTDKMLQYLEDFPADKKLELLFKTYRDLYQHELLDKMENVTPALLIMFSIEKRIKFCQEMIRTKSFNNKLESFNKTRPYEETLTCYLSAHEAILIFKYIMKYAETPQSKLNFILKMIYTCKVNKDEDELYNVLSYIIDEGHVINDFTSMDMAFDTISEIFSICEVPFVNKRNGSLLCYMIRSFYIQYNSIYGEIVVDMVHFRLINNMQIADLIDILIGGENFYFQKLINMIKYNPQYERRCLVFFIERAIKVLERINSSQLDILESLDSALYQLLIAIYDFNERWCNNSRTKMQRITIKNYPPLINIIDSIIDITRNTFYRKQAMNMLRRHEPDLYHNWCTRSLVKNLTPREVLRLLKNNYQSILNNWEEYLTDCKTFYRDKYVQRFVRATRWYKDIPVKFAERCISDLQRQSITRISSALVFLSLLLHGNLLAQLLDQSFLIEKIRIDNVNNTNTDYVMFNAYYNVTFSYGLSIIISNPPVPFKLIMKLGNHSKIENVMSRVMQRFFASDLNMIMSYFMKNMSSFMIRKCWIHSMCLIAPINEQIIFLNEMWTTERHPLVQITLLEAILMLFRDNPCPEIALLLQQMRALFPAKNKYWVLSFFEESVSYFESHPSVWKFFDLWLEVIAIYGDMDHTAEFTEECTKACLNQVFFESENFDINNVLQKFLFHANYGISKAMQDFALPHLLCSKEILLFVINNILPNTLISLQSKCNAECSSVIRHNVYLFLEKFIVEYKSFSSDDYYVIIEKLLKIFTEESLIKENPQSFLLLEYTRIMCMSETKYIELSSEHSPENSKEFFFREELACRIPYLVKMFSPQSMRMMAQVLMQFLELFYKDDLHAVTYIAKALQKL